MRNMSYRLTTAQIIARLKRVTRRVGWTYLRPGDRLCAIEKGQGLKKGERVRRLGILRVVDVRFEPLQRLLDDISYGLREITLEGFPPAPAVAPEWAIESFVSMFLDTHDSVTLRTPLTRIAFDYEDTPPAGFEWRIADDRQNDELRLGRRVVATLWEHDDCFAWHTWDRDGVGGENAADSTRELAQREAIAALVRQAKREPARWWPIEAAHA